jgi:hypothetical protein
LPSSPQISSISGLELDGESTSTQISGARSNATEFCAFKPGRVLRPDPHHIDHLDHIKSDKRACEESFAQARGRKALEKYHPDENCGITPESSSRSSAPTCPSRLCTATWPAPVVDQFLPACQMVSALKRKLHKRIRHGDRPPLGGGSSFAFASFRLHSESSAPGFRGTPGDRHRVVRQRPAGPRGKLLSRSTSCFLLYVLPVVIGTKNTRLTGTSDRTTYSTEPGSRKFWATQGPIRKNAGRYLCQRY